MQKHIKIYFDHFRIGEQDDIYCQACQRGGRVDKGGFDIHHIHGRGKGKNVIENLILLCRKCHKKAHDGQLNKTDLEYIHNHKLLGHTKRFVK